MEQTDKTYFESVKEFQKTFKNPVGEKPAPLDFDRLLKRLIWTAEELVEAIHGSSASPKPF